MSKTLYCVGYSLLVYPGQIGVVRGVCCPPYGGTVKTLLHCGGSVITTAFHPNPSFPGYAPVQIAAAPMGPRQYLPPPIFYWPYPSPPVSPTNYYPTMPPPGAIAQQPQQMVPPECVALSPMGPIPSMDAARLMQEAIPRPDHEKARQAFPPNQYVELII